MNKIAFNIDKNSIGVSKTLYFGHIYLVFSCKKDIQKKIFGKGLKNVCFINSPFKGAIKVPIYIRKHKINPKKIEYLKEHFRIPFLKIDKYGFYNQMIFVLLNELIQNDIVVVEATGLAKHSINYFIEFSNNFLRLNKNKMIVLFQIKSHNLSISKFIIEDLSETGIKGYSNILNKCTLAS